MANLPTEELLVRICQAFLLLLTLGAGTAWGAPPSYEKDPFGDDDFIDPPLIRDVAHTTGGRFEVGLMYTGSAIDKYSSHHGFMLDANFHFLDTLGAGVAFSYYHGQLTNIVTSRRGILGIKMNQCRKAASDCDEPGELNPNVPDYKQLTGVLTLQLIWSPLYGKINLVSEIDVNLQLFFVVGGGIHGRREVVADPCPVGGTSLSGFPKASHCPAGGPADDLHYQLNRANFGEGGLFDDPSGHGMASVGVRVFLLDWFNLRADFRALVYGDSFDFDEQSDTPPSPYVSFFYTAQVGLGFVIF